MKRWKVPDYDTVMHIIGVVCVGAVCFAGGFLISWNILRLLRN